jgi:hypothetical protein
VAHRLAGLSDGDRPGRPRTITDAQVEQVVTTTLEQARRCQIVCVQDRRSVDRSTQ